MDLIWSSILHSYVHLWTVVETHNVHELERSVWKWKKCRVKEATCRSEDMLLGCLKDQHKEPELQLQLIRYRGPCAETQPIPRFRVAELGSFFFFSISLLLLKGKSSLRNCRWGWTPFDPIHASRLLCWLCLATVFLDRTNATSWRTRLAKRASFYCLLLTTILSPLIGSLCLLPNWDFASSLY